MNNTIKKAAGYFRQAIDNKDDFRTATMIHAEHLKKTAEGMGREIEIYIDNRRENARPSWDRLINDCRAGKIDLIIMRSISRLGRNVADVLETLRDLKSLGIQIYFESEGLHTCDGNFDKVISVLSSAAGAEQTNKDA